VGEGNPPPAPAGNPKKQTRFTFLFFLFPYRNPFFLPIPSPVMPGSGRSLFIIALVVITLAVVLVLNAGIFQQGDTSGTLTGTVTIGPLCPVEPCSVPRDQILAAYAARPLLIWSEGGTFVQSVTADPDTGYSVSLRSGTYVVDITHQGIGGSPDLPRTVTLRPGETVRLDIEIDTGIR